MVAPSGGDLSPPLRRRTSPARGGWGRGLIEDEGSFAGGGGLEEAEGVGGLVEGEAVGDQPAERDVVIDDELGAFLQADRAEGPGAVERQLFMDDVGAGVEGDGVALADEAGAAPDARRADGLRACLRVASAVERGLGTLAVRQFLDRRDWIALRRVDDDVGPEFAREGAAL